MGEAAVSALAAAGRAVLRPGADARSCVARDGAGVSDAALAAASFGVRRDAGEAGTARSFGRRRLAPDAVVAAAGAAWDAEVAAVAAEVQGGSAGAWAVVAVVRRLVARAADVGLAEAVLMAADGDGVREEEVEVPFA